MPGVTKHIYEHDIRDIMSMWTTQLKSIQMVLPQKYTDRDIISTLKKYYPHEWNSVEIKYWYYQEKDKSLKQRFGKTRYNMKKPEELLQTHGLYKKFTSLQCRQTYAANFSVGETAKLENALWKKRQPKISKIDEKIARAVAKTQQVTPNFLDQLIGLYERKNTTQKDRMYILAELKKYYNPQIIRFFFKINDTELNKQLRRIAFCHLQSFNYQPRMRRQEFMQVHTKSKKRKEYLKKVYPDEKYDIPQCPDELEYRIENAKEQKIQTFDFFISHSSKDSKSIQSLILYENKQGKNIFCDWINDADYLKRHLVCKATLKVIEKRLEQSKALLYVISSNSLNSVWCKYELNYFFELGKPMYVILKEDIDKGVFQISALEDKWFIDPAYKELALGAGSIIQS